MLVRAPTCLPAFWQFVINKKLLIFFLLPMVVDKQITLAQAQLTLMLLSLLTVSFWHMNLNLKLQTPAIHTT